MGTYLSEPELFNDAVREMTGLFSKVYLSDLVGYQHNPLGHIENVGDFVRYDNLPLYIVENNGKRQGKIGLIDLEHMETSPSSGGLETLVRIFPLHLELIKEEASKLGMRINTERLEAAAEKGRKYLQVGYSNHLKWLEEKGPLSEVATQFADIDSSRKAELTEVVEKELIKLNQGVNEFFVKRGYLGEAEKDFFTESPEDVAKELAANISPLIIANIRAAILESQQKQLEKIAERNPTESEIVSLRSPILKRPKLYKGVETLINDHEKVKFKGTWGSEAREMAEQLIVVVIDELIKGGELFMFDPAYYTGGHDLCWVRC